MRLLLKQNIMKMLDLMKHVQRTVSQQWESGDEAQLFEWLTQLQEAAMEIGEAVEAQEEPHEALISCLEKYCESLYQLSQAAGDESNADCLIADCDEKLAEICRYVEQTDVQIKIAFFPYKYSMWDSLESIWKAASKDERCECQVVPVPYYNKGTDGKLEELHYEGESFEKDIPILDYRNYNIEAENPDIVYIHNPYDEYNKVTCVHPVFFMENLKKRGAVMVYVPYYVARCCRKYEDLGSKYRTKGAVLSDYIVLQCDKLKTAYEYSGIDSEKLIVAGSPKIDKICKLKERNQKGKSEWKSIVEDRKVFLFCSSISDMLTDDNWIHCTNQVIDCVLADKSQALIWRPHPLLLQTLKTLKKDYVQEYLKICEKVQEAENGVIDESGDFGDAMAASDGMISDCSSLILQYTFLEKPILILRGDSKERNGEVFCDYFSNYFVDEGTTIDDFVEMVKEGRDEKKEERIRLAKASVANSDGTCGEKAHEMVIKRICFWE